MRVSRKRFVTMVGAGMAATASGGSLSQRVGAAGKTLSLLVGNVTFQPLSRRGAGELDPSTGPL